MVVLPARRTVIGITLGSLAAALFILFAAVLPAQFGRDPTGLGRLTGISALWAPAQPEIAATPATAIAPASHSFPTAFRSDVVDIVLKASGDKHRGDEVEYKVRLPKGGSYIYSWTVPGIAAPEEFYTEFHGHTVTPGKPMTVVYYRKASGASDNGILTAPFAGVHGWYFQNQSVQPVKVRLRLSGFYTLIPDGEPGNEAGIHARRIE
ncbi:hypothetical protein PX699_26100 [Sphingobium sp. H39-3-25]|uniref:hypothetical protein n=1 Tax=Sphingobium arseniciresistens TaxID=3030834 RepID=UPI0023B99012|nr:hypothetical protein [Sphingobium arseniciresistens]